MKTFLFEEHQALGAKFVDFAGWEMPLSYQSTVKEHEIVRTEVGIFDISHMGRISVEGLDAADFLDYIATNSIDPTPINKAVYTPLCDRTGGTVDDVIIYRHQRNHFSVVVNASNRDKDLQHFLAHSKNFEVEIQPHFEQEGILAIQGPKSAQLLGSFFKEIHELKFMRSTNVDYNQYSLFIARTGYTGELGYEIYGKQEALKELWKELLNDSQTKLTPIGLGARDLLRLEMGFALYGHELSDLIAPTESVAFWAVKLNKENFLGKEALESLMDHPKRRSQHGVILEGQVIARPGMEVLINGIPKGKVTSGTFSPSLQKAIAIIMIEGKIMPEDQVTLSVRNKQIPAHIVGLPFYKKK